MPLKRCQRCGTICQDADIVCGICGSKIANTPTLKASIEDEMLRDRKEAERRSTPLNQTFTRASKRRLLRKLLTSISTLAIGSATVTYAIVYRSSLGPIYTGTSLPLF
ncbi:hypothetical protein E6H33_03870 [Candidatus Bathyarchaeota archaeon]|nr:MAG: hypothetical protein E6H33_03870 [Candidatus Bathyarchaeota archaeon]